MALNCLLCVSPIGDTNMRYHIGNMESELTSEIEFHIDHEVQDGEVCEDCFNSIVSNASFSSNRDRSIMQDDHRCIWCSSSLFSRRSHDIPESPQRIVITEQIFPRVLHEGALECNSCWRRAGNMVRSQNIEMIEPSPPVVNTNICVLCAVTLSRRRTHSLPSGPERNYVAVAIHPREIQPSGRVCWNCWRRAQRNATNESLNNQEVENEELPELPELPQQPQLPRMVINSFKKVANTSRHCIVPNCDNVERLQVPQFLRRHIFKMKRIYVGKNCRVCPEHKELYNWDVLDDFNYSNIFNQNEIEDMLEINIDSDNSVPINFENINDHSDNIIKYWTGVTKSQYSQILQEIPNLAMQCKYPKLALGLFLIKSRTGDSHDRIASLFQISKAKLIKLLNAAREALLTEFVPRHVGLEHISRDELILKNLLIPEGLFGGIERKPIVICDGSYIYVQKSSNYLFQKDTYSLHKHSNLVKPFLIVACDGYILDVQGPYRATESDAHIMRALFQDENSQHRLFFEENDIFILDRGFRDSIPLLESLNYKVYKPESVDHGQTQLSTIKANKSRFVTLCRWVVEIVNGRFKRDYKLFRQEYFNLAAGHLFDDFKICAALINAFHPLILNRPDAHLLLRRALERFNMPNDLADYVVNNNINRRRAQFVNINENNPALDIFPQMTISDLTMFSLGTYQIKQARSYYGEHIRRNGSFEVEISNVLEQTIIPDSTSSHEALLLRGRIKSRHQSAKIYNTYILLNPEGELWDSIIERYYCSCVCGKRTVGCCSHVMTIVWYLGWARHQDDIECPAAFLDAIFVEQEE